MLQTFKARYITFNDFLLPLKYLNRENIPKGYLSFHLCEIVKFTSCLYS